MKKTYYILLPILLCVSAVALNWPAQESDEPVYPGFEETYVEPAPMPMFKDIVGAYSNGGAQGVNNLREGASVTENSVTLNGDTLNRHVQGNSRQNQLQPGQQPAASTPLTQPPGNRRYMNTQTGEIKEFGPGSGPPLGWVRTDQ